MKRILTLSMIIFSGLTADLSAQFFKGWGVMGGITLGRQNWKSDLVDYTGKQKYRMRYNGEIFAEFGNHPIYRWVTEAQYSGKGGRYKDNVSDLKFKSDYFAWNNYLMIRKELFAIIPYVKIGPRLEYVWKTDQSFDQFHITGSAGAGIEFVAYGPVKFITEMHWVPDATRSYDQNNLLIKQHAWELRVGLKFAYQGGGESCPPVYK